jgi:hypothetical protein
MIILEGRIGGGGGIVVVGKGKRRGTKVLRDDCGDGFDVSETHGTNDMLGELVGLY